MSGDWIKMRRNLRSHPKVVRMASALKADKLRVIGGLHAVWCVFDEHSTDGRLAGYTLDAVDSEIGWRGFAKAMLDVCWLATDGDACVAVPEFDEHNGKSAKRRAEDTKRKAESRSGPKEIADLSAKDADKLPTDSGPEKRREEKEEKKELPPTAGDPPAKMDPVKDMIDGAIGYMAETGVDQKQARSLVGMLRRDLKDDTEVAAKLAQMQRDRIARPAEWIAGVCRAAKRAPSGSAGGYVSIPGEL